MKADEFSGGAPILLPILKDFSYIHYRCPHCDYQIKMATPALLATQAVTFSSLLILIVILLSQYGVQIWRELDSGLSSAVVLLPVLLLCFLAFGGLWNGLAFIHEIRKRHLVPTVSRQGFFFYKLIAHFLYSLIPWGYWAGVGILNDLYLDIDDDLVLFFVLPGVLPFFLAQKFGLTPTIVFLLSASYPTIGLVWMWLT